MGRVEAWSLSDDDSDDNAPLLSLARASAQATWWHTTGQAQAPTNKVVLEFTTVRTCNHICSHARRRPGGEPVLPDDDIGTTSLFGAAMIESPDEAGRSIETNTDDILDLTSPGPYTNGYWGTTDVPRHGAVG